MSNTNETRWRQRLENFGRALSQLDELCKPELCTNIELLALVKIFELSQELGWQTLKDLLAHESREKKFSREVIREAFRTGYLSESDFKLFLDAIKKRNKLSHVYAEKEAREAELIIKQKIIPCYSGSTPTWSPKLNKNDGHYPCARAPGIPVIRKPLP